jgi:hypothetical protein
MRHVGEFRDLPPDHGTSGTAPSQEILSPTAETAKRAIPAGHFAPTFRLQDLHGGSVALIDLIERDPSMISLYRGLWCSFCDTAIEALAGIEDNIRALGATHVRSGPRLCNGRQRVRLDTFPMPILIERGPTDVVDLWLDDRPPGRSAGAVCKGRVCRAERSGQRQAVGADSRNLSRRSERAHCHAAIDTDYRNRLEPSQLLSALRSLQRAAA